MKTSVKNSFMIYSSHLPMRLTAAFLASLIIVEILIPTLVFAAAGSTQQEYSNFESAGNSEMVNLYTGDLTYNLPLLTLPGAGGAEPINLSYHSGDVTMDAAASWVGFGWTLNAGAVNRSEQGIPDDFDGSQEIEYKYDFKPMKRFSVWPKGLPIPKGGKGTKTNGVHDEGLGDNQIKIYYDSYNGIGFTTSKNNGKYTYDSQTGFNYRFLSAEYSYNKNLGFCSVGGTASVSASYHNRTGGVNAKMSLEASVSKGSLAASYGGEVYLLGENFNVPTNETPTITSGSKWPMIVSWDVSIGTHSYNYGWFELENTKTEAVSSEKRNAYGYLYDNKAKSDKAARDVNRPHKPYTKHAKVLGGAIMTSDVFSYSAHGAGGTFKPASYGVKYVSTPKVESATEISVIPIDLGFLPFTAIVGGGYQQNRGKEISGPWKEQSEFDLSVKDGYAASFDEKKKEHFYMQDLNDVKIYPTDLNKNQLNAWGGENAVRADMKTHRWDLTNPRYTVENKYLPASSSTQPLSSVFVSRKERDKRNTIVQHLTCVEAHTYGTARFVTHAVASDTLKKEIKKLIGEIAVLQTDGSRFNYALPVYNLNAKEVTYSVNNVSGIGNNNVHVFPDEESNYKSNSQSKQFLRQSEITSRYASSWLITQKTSADYLDISENGPTNDDFGFWVKYEYDKKADYDWHLPHKGGYFYEGKKGVAFDDIASNSSGIREQYYLKKIETKTHIAIFETSDRTDGVSPKGVAVQKLDKIKVYVKSEYLNNPTSAIPQQTVLFTYGYSLCPNTPSGSGSSGKLTLLSVRFLNQNSGKGWRHAYTFDYNTFNPEYNLLNRDRWGQPQNNTQGLPEKSMAYNFVDFPYTNQNAASTAGAWLLKSVNLPTGAKLSFEYERDDYAYVENKNAMEMFDIRGIDLDKNSSNGNVSTHNPRAKLGTPDKAELGGDGNQQTTRIYFQLNQPIPATYIGMEEHYLRTHLLRDMKMLYFKSLIGMSKLDKADDGKEQMEYVDGVAEIDTDPGSIGMLTGSSNIAFVTVKTVKRTYLNLGNERVHPFMKRGFQTLRLDRTDIMFGVGNGKDPKGGASAFETLWNDVQTLFTGFNNTAWEQKRCRKIYLNGNSVIRLYNANGFKYGGDVRVKTITLTDGWKNSAATAATDAYDYVQRYDYTTLNEQGERISSGVAYEPMQGVEENAYHQLEPYTETNLPFAQNEFYTTRPYQLHLYPGASVGYRKVTVSTVYPTGVLVDKTAAPINIYGFYTPKEFPVIEDKTDMNQTAVPIRSQGGLSPFYSTSKSKLGKTQGFVMVRNDMAGKLRYIEQRTTKDEFISRQEYVYKTKAGKFNENSVNELDNTVKTINSAGDIEEHVVGVDHDIFVDNHENTSETKNTIGAEVGLYIYLTPSYITPTVNPLLGISKSESSFRTAVISKIVYKKGILEKVKTIKDESEIDTEYLLYDSETAEPILTKVTNEFKDPIYKQNIPGHWKYPDMLGAYKNIGMEFTGLWVNASKKVIIPGASTSLKNGDIVYVKMGTAKNYLATVESLLVDEFKLVYYGSKLDNGSRSGEVIDAGGLPNAFSIKVIQSGYENLQSVSVGEISAQELVNPSLPIGPFAFKTDKILNASAITFDDKWDYMCDCIFPNHNYTDNDYRIGRKGIWRPSKSYTLYSGRRYNEASADKYNGIRNEGHVTGYVPFNWPSPASPWVLSSQVLKYSMHGETLEQQDALGLYSGALYGYDNVLLKGVVSNAKSESIGFESFEEGLTPGCEDKKGFRFINAKGGKITPTTSYNLSNSVSHTGKNSLIVAPNSEVKFKQVLKKCD